MNSAADTVSKKDEGRTFVPLLDSQKSLLERCSVPPEHQKLLENWLTGGEGLNQKSSLDFLQLLSDLLQTAEKHLQAKRMELAAKVKKSPGLIAPAETPAEILALEDTIKNSWQTAAALWLAVDQVVRFPEEYSLTLTRQHAEYAIATRNLPVIELLKWNKPEFFEVGQPFTITRQINWVICGILGAFLGLFGGFFGGLKAGWDQRGIKKLLFPLYGILGMLIGWSSTAVRAARLGYRTGRFLLTCKLALITSYMSPFHAPRGSQTLQAVELKIEEILFAESKRVSKL